MLTKEQIDANRVTFLKLIAEIKIEGADIQGLVEFLDQNDFFTAPASTIYHGSYAGGLCEHSLNVYRNLKMLVDKYKDTIDPIEDNTILILGLLHDISKVNFYESYVMNKKIYSDKGSKSDNHGRFDWFAEDAWKVRDVHDRFLGGDHGFNSMMIVGKFIPLSYPESVAIYNHHAGMGDKAAPPDLSAIYNKYPIATLLHIADMLAVYMDERI